MYRMMHEMQDFDTRRLVLFALLLGVAIILLARWLSRNDRFLDLLSNLGTGSWFASVRHERRAERIRDPFPPVWERYLDDNVHMYALLRPAEQQRLRDDVRILIAEKQWEGCAGLTMTDEIQVTIAAQACILLLGMDRDYYPDVTSILVYPSTFYIPAEQRPPDSPTGSVSALGQAWYRGPVILAWDQVLAGGRRERRGHNVVFHEFAHQLDFAGDHGSHKRADREQWQKWQQVMADEYQQLVEAAKERRPTLLDKYGASSPAEFFAVATECFFEQAMLMQEHHPSLYAVLREYYGQDTARRFALS